MAKMTNLKSALAATAIAGIAMVGPAAALPAAHLDFSTPAESGLQNARWVCGPYRCWWRPNYYNYYGPPRRWGWHRGWRRW